MLGISPALPSRQRARCFSSQGPQPAGAATGPVMAKHFEGTASVHGAVVCVPGCPLNDRAVPGRDFLTGEVLTGCYQLPGAGVQGDLFKLHQVHAVCFKVRSAAALVGLQLPLGAAF